MESEFVNGKCPFCSGSMKRIGENLLECEDGDYQVLEAEWERIWTLFEQMDKPTREDNTERLLEDLQNGNLIKPVKSDE